MKPKVSQHSRKHGSDRQQNGEPYVLSPPPRPETVLWRIATFLALSSWIFGLLAVACWWVLTILLLPAYPASASASLGVFVALLVAPLNLSPPAPVQQFLKFSLSSAFKYFPVTVVYEDFEALNKKRPFVVGYEPHSVLPQGICAFCEYAADSPPLGLQKARILVSSAGFWAPVMRHLWWWLGCRPASRSVAKKLLSKGHTVALCPGGVQECIYMQPGVEVAYLKNRRGFIRLALEAGAPIVPVFAFGQSKMFRYLRPLLDPPHFGLVPKSLWARIARRIGYAPMIVWGLWGTAMPRPVALRIVVGKPIDVPPFDGDKQIGVNPKLVDMYLKKFIVELENLYKRHKKEAGYLDEDLIVY
jgi:1-acyl-sn-glycerol-3-phosphate acyltransferase